MVRFGVLTDLHYADKPDEDGRCFRASLTKLDEIIATFNAQPLDFVVCLGDVIDSNTSLEAELRDLTTVEAKLAQLHAPRHYVLGNHCVERLTKAEFIAHTAARKPYYAFDVGDVRFVVLDACYRPDGTPHGRHAAKWEEAFIPEPQRAWLADTLASTDRRAVILAHQRLDIASRYGVSNQEAVRQTLEAAGNVMLVLQAHNHVNDCRTIAGIPYITFTSIVEGSGANHNAYAVVEIGEAGQFSVRGFCRQARWDTASACDATT